MQCQVKNGLLKGMRLVFIPTAHGEGHFGNNLEVFYSRPVPQLTDSSLAPRLVTRPYLLTLSRASHHAPTDLSTYRCNAGFSRKGPHNSSPHATRPVNQP